MHSRLFLLQAASAQPAPTSEARDDRNQAFRPVDGANQMQSGEALLVEAYAAIWLIVFLFVLFSWRRQAKLDERIRTLEDAIAKARTAAGDAKS